MQKTTTWIFSSLFRYQSPSSSQALGFGSVVALQLNYPSYFSLLHISSAISLITENYFVKLTSGLSLYFGFHYSIIETYHSYYILHLSLSSRWKICETEGCNRSFSQQCQQWHSCSMWQMGLMHYRCLQCILFFSSLHDTFLIIKFRKLAISSKGCSELM